MTAKQLDHLIKTQLQHRVHMAESKLAATTDDDRGWLPELIAAAVAILALCM